MAAHVERALGVEVQVYGFDNGAGLPRPEDFRDLPNIFREGEYPLDEGALRARLGRAELIVGEVGETVGPFLARDPAPIGFISFDLDLYTSTMRAFPLLEAEPERLLPRVQCPFDDILGMTYAAHNGERLAIAEFNAAHEARKISPIFGAEFFVPRRVARDNWVQKLFMAHVLDHPRYGDPDGLVRPGGAGPEGAFRLQGEG